MRRLSSRSRSSGAGLPPRTRPPAVSTASRRVWVIEQVAAPLDLLGQSGEAPGREADGREQEERAQRDREPDAERARQAAPARRAEPDAHDQLGDQPEHAQDGRVQQHHQHAAHGQRHRAAEIDRRVHHAPSAGKIERVLVPHRPRLASPASRRRRGGRVHRWTQRETIERRLRAPGVEQPADPSRHDSSDRGPTAAVITASGPTRTSST